MGIFVIAGGHAAPLFEPADAPFDGVARLVPFRVVGLGGFVRPFRAGMTASVPRCASHMRKPSLSIGPVGHQAGPRRVRPGFHQGPSLGAVVARAARHAQAQEPAAAIRQDMDLGAEAAPAAPQGVIRPWTFRGARRAHVRARGCCPAARRTDPGQLARMASGAPRGPGCTRPHTGDEFHCPYLGATGAKGRTHGRSRPPPPPKDGCGRQAHVYTRTGAQVRWQAGPLCVRQRARGRRHEALLKADTWDRSSPRITAGARDSQSPASRGQGLSMG